MESPYETVEVTEVIDGDTVKIMTDEGEDTVRLVGVDAPETFMPNEPHFFGMEDTQENRECLREYGHEATGFVKEKVEGETVRLEEDMDEGPRDIYDRRLAYIYPPNSTDTLGYHLLREGYGTVYPTTFMHQDRYSYAESQAVSREKRVWGCG